MLKKLGCQHLTQQVIQLVSVIFSGSYADPAPLTTGWFAIRTAQSHLVIKNLQISQLPDE
jgi:hypothetical protein